MRVSHDSRIADPGAAIVRASRMSRTHVELLALLGAATLAMPTLAQTGHHVVCDGASTTVRLGNAASVALDQNSPNPFAHATTISYTLPDKVTRAQLMFYDARSKLLKAIDVTSRGGRSDGGADGDADCAGTGRVIVFADDLEDGSYTYTLVLDGRVVDSKTMVKSERH